MDKDGTLIPDIPFNVDPGLVAIDKGTIDGLRLLSELGYLLILVSNQPGIARGYYTEKDLQKVWKRIDDLLRAERLSISGFYYCPHEPGAPLHLYNKICDCRKPLPGLIMKAARELDIDRERSWMIGDILHDAEAGNRAGCKTILINNGNEGEWKITKWRKPTLIAKTIYEAASLIVRGQTARAKMK